jgi:hypothetical protein
VQRGQITTAVAKHSIVGGFALELFAHRKRITHCNRSFTRISQTRPAETTNNLAEIRAAASPGSKLAGFLLPEARWSSNYGCRPTHPHRRSRRHSRSAIPNDSFFLEGITAVRDGPCLPAIIPMLAFCYKRLKIARLALTTAAIEL